MRGEVGKELSDLEQMWTRAILRNRAEEIARFMTDDWVIIGPGGEVIDKSRFLRAIESGDLTHARMDSDEWRVRVYEDTAVVTARVISEGKFKGEPFRTEERSTSVYARDEGRWTCVLTQVTPLRSK